MIRYKNNAEKCREANAKAYKRRPVFKGARQIKKAMASNSNFLKDIDFGMIN